MISLVDYVKQINEAQIYDGGEELCKYICKVIKDNPSESFIVINEEDLNFKNIFFKHLLLYVNDNIKEALYKANYHYNRIKHEDKVKYFENNLLKWNVEEKKFNYIEISIITTDKNDRDLEWGDIAHELNHAWDDYNEKLKDPNRHLMSDVDIEKYGIAKDIIQNGKDSVDYVIGNIEYMGTESETKSFSVQAMAKLKDNLDKYSNFNDALDWQLQHNKVFIAYAKIQKHFNIATSNKFSIDSLCRRYRKRFIKYEKLTNDEIIDSLTNKLINLYKALTEDINTILDDYAKKNAL